MNNIAGGIRIGVINNNSAAYLDEEYAYRSIDPEWEALSEEEQEEISDGNAEWEPSYVLIGSWVKDENGLYTPDTENPDAEYAATFSLDPTYNTCVMWSRYVIYCNVTSPCYIQSDGQRCGDLDTPGVTTAYCLPPDMFDPDMDEFRVSEIRKVGE